MKINSESNTTSLCQIYVDWLMDSASSESPAPLRYIMFPDFLLEQMSLSSPCPNIG